MAKEKYQNALLQSMSIIADQSVKRAGYDTTIQATIIKCVDPTIEQYQIKYQGAYWYAYGNGAGVNYPNGCNVYILVPKGDMSQLKTILGTVQKLGINYVNPIAEENKYEETGGNVLSQNTNEFGLCSYKKKDTLVLYKENGTNNKISINNNSLKYYFQTASHLCCSFDIRTNLNPEQKYQGKYGIKFIVEEQKTNDKTKTVEKTYTIDTDNFTGNPYNFQNKITQKIFIEFNMTNFKQIKEISLFAEGFPVYNSKNTTADIFFSNLSFKGMKMLTQEEMDGVSLSFVARKGYIFESGGTSQLPIEAIVRVAGKTVNNSIQSLKYYWFVKNAYITASNVYYCKEGGKGWKCLNNYKVLSGTKTKPTKIEYNSGKPILTIKKSDVLVKQVKYKCVVIYGNESFSKQFTIKNNATNITVTVTSDKGTQFVSGLGTPTLTCNLSSKPKNVNTIHYHWTVTDQAGFSTEINSTSNKITYDVQKIIGFNKFTCTVTDDNYNLIGSGQITLVNKKTSDGGYILTITNGEQVFNYNEQGISPCKNKLINFVIPQLSFTLLDKNGKDIDKSTIDKNNITWAITGSSEIINNLTVASNKLTATYKINDYFKNNVRNDNIRLTIIYAGYTIVANTRFTFTRQGFSGTNGTGIVARIVVNYNNNVKDDNYVPILYKDALKTKNNADSELKLSNFKSVTAELWRNGNKVQSIKENGENEWTCVWSILKNSNEETYLEIISPKNVTTKIRRKVNKSGAIIPITSYVKNFSNILQATIIYSGKRYYATMPIITADENGSYIIYLKENTGFEEVVYLDDGTYPNYSNRTFSFVVKNGDKDVTDSSNFRYVDNRPVTKQTQITYDIDDKGKKNPQPNRGYRPSANFDGSNTAKYLRCQATYSGKNIHINIPIYHHLNLYGHSALNEWNGNSIEFDSTDNGVSTILTPQIGAGSKDNDNKFTGMLMGKVKGDDGTKTGLFGYSKGARSIFLDANTGNATFGIAGKGQIIMKPDSGTITGGKYEPGKTGMQIDLKTPSIKFGSGNFSVTSKGQLTAKGGGSIAGWDIDDTSLSKEGKISRKVNKKTETKKVTIVGINSDNTDRENKDGTVTKAIDRVAFYAGRNWDNTPRFKVTFGGAAYMQECTIAGNIHITENQIYSGKHNDFEDTNEGFYLGPTGLSLGSNFSVDKNGKITARSGYIGNSTAGFIINDNNIHSKDRTKFSTNKAGIYLGTDGISLGKSGKFSVTDEGVLKATSGTIGTWHLSDDGIYNDTTPTYYKKDKKGNTVKDKNGNKVVENEGIYFGSGGIRLGANFHVNNEGNLYANDGVFAGKITSSEGKIGDWTLSATGLTSSNGNMKLDSAGNITAGNIKINSDGSMSGWGYQTNDKGEKKKKTWSIGTDGKATFSDINVTGGNWTNGSISGGTISNNRTGGSIKGGSISPSKVNCGKNKDGSDRTMNQWCQNVSFNYITVTKKATIKSIAAETITADYITSALVNAKVADIKSLGVKGSIEANTLYVTEKIKIGEGTAATQGWVTNNYCAKSSLKTVTIGNQSFKAFPA